MNKKEPQFVDQLTHLFVLSMEGTIGEDQFRTLTNILKTNTAAREYYYDFIASYIGLDQLGILSEQNDDQESWSRQQMWDELLKFEKTAPEMDIPAVSKEPEVEEKSTEAKKGRTKVSKFSIISLVLSSAALIFVIVYAQLTSMRQGVEVATLTDSMNAKWADITLPMANGTRMVTGNERFLLREGYAELRFDNQTQVTFEGPAEFQILAEDRIGLSYGKMYTRVPKEAIGFSVYTKNAKIIDLGTEFGVQVEIGGNTQLYVLKGKTMLMAGRTDKVNMEVSQGNAKKISGKTGEISATEYQSDYFVRNINSKSNCIWRGQNQIDLADIVGGGSGFGNGQIGEGIDLISGKMTTTVGVGYFEGTGRYIQVDWSSFIDGVFVPDGGQGPVQISSEGNEFSDCPDTTGVFFDPIMNGGFHTYLYTSQKAEMKLNGQVYGTKQAPALYIHTNAGITYDLQAIRQANSFGQIKRFKAIGGISENSSGRLSKSDIYVLLDGKVCFQATGITMQDTPLSIDVEIDPGAKYLTLISTDGGDGNDVDWVIFAEPVLELAVE